MGAEEVGIFCPAFSIVEASAAQRATDMIPAARRLDVTQRAVREAFRTACAEAQL
jgi:hypothetical protein